MASFPSEEERDDEEPTEDEQEYPSDVYAEGDLEEQEEKEVLLEKQKKPEEVKRKISENFFYNYEDICSRPFVPEDSEIPMNLLTLKYSFGYDCARPVNLLMMDNQELLYIAGNQVVIQELKTKFQRFIRSSGGGGIGFITAHPTKQYFAVGEKGKKPNLVIYKYPSLTPYRILQGGTEKAYVFGDFNRAGTLLATVGSSPDFMLTIWDWKQEEIMLRSKAFGQDVYMITFSAENEEHLTTSGSGHIKFWTMALTLTGLKLQGALGRFGKTAVSDILGFVELPDGKVVSGTEWGNLLLWEGGLIKVELCRTGHKPCHHGPVSQLVLEEGELITVGKDGFIRTWNFEIIDGADSVDETGLLEVEPMNELCVGKNVSLNFMTKVHDQERTFWYAQDTNGAIWKLDLTFSNMTHDPECLCTFHSGRIEAISVSPITYLMATTALDRSVRIFDFSSNIELSEIKFKQGGTALIWAPHVVNPNGGLIAVGFEDGVVRMIEIYDPKQLLGFSEEASAEKAEINLKQAFKPHTAAVTALAYEQNGNVFATGSKDKTVFFFAAKDEYKPIGFIYVPGPVQALQWSPPSHEKSMLLILCENGFAVQVPAPFPVGEDMVSTYQIKNLPTQYFHFYSVKSRIKLEEEIALREKKKKERERLQWMQEQKETGHEIEEEPLPPLYIPEEPSPILCGFYSAPGKFWLSLGGYDSGFLYHCEFSHDHEENPENRKDEPFEVIPIEGTDNNPIHQISFCASRRLMFFGMQDGSLRVYPLLEKELSVNTLKKYWCLNVHDNDSGQIQCICSSFDDTFLITCGGDGNIFTFDILSLEGVPKERKAKIPSPRSGLEKEKAVEDIVDPDAYNIEEVKQKKESERIKKEAEEKKNKEREEIIALRHDFVSVLQKNQELPKHMQLRKEEYEMDHRIFEELDREKAQRIQLVQNELSQEREKQLIGLRKLQKLCWDSLELTVVVHAFQSNHQVSTYRLLKEAEKYSQDKEQVGSKWKILRDKWRILKQAEETKETKITTETSQVHTDTTVSEVKPETVKMPEVQKPTACYIAIKREKIRGIVEKSDKMQAQVMKRKGRWDELYKSKPNDDYEDPKDAEEITEAQENRGYYKLKPASDYGLPEHKYVNTSRKMMQLKSLKRLIHRKKVNMNKEIMSLRDLKVSVFDEIECLVQELKSIQATLDESERLPLPLIPQLHPDEVLEKKFECNSDIFLNFNEEQAKAKLQGQLEGSASFRAFRHGFIPTPSVDEVEPVAQAAGAHRMSTEQQNVFEMEKAEPTEIELEILKREKIKSLYLQETLIKEINMLVISFDAEVCFWRHKKLKMDVQMKNADLRCITCSKELLILKKREKLEKPPQQRIHTLIREQEAIQSELKSYLAKMEERKCEILKLQESKKALYASFKASLGEDNEFAHFLTKVLRKKNECVEKKEGNKADDDEEDGEESDLWTNGGSSGSEDEDFDDSVCPDDCDEALFLNTIQLRQQRLDIEEAFAEEKKVAADLRREYNALAEEAKEVENSLNMTKRDLEILQWEKLQRLNELYVPVPLKIHQVQCLVDGKMPSDFFQALVFTSQSLKYLQESIADLQSEKIMHREAQEKYKQLLQEKKQMELESQRLEEKCNHLMIEKFGRLIDLGAVQGYSVNVPMEDMKVKTLEKEYERSLELRKWEERILELQQQLVKVREENSSKLLQLNKFCREKHQLETKLDSLPNDLEAEFQGTQTRDITETACDAAFLREESNLGRKGV